MTSIWDGRLSQKTATAFSVSRLCLATSARSGFSGLGVALRGGMAPGAAALEGFNGCGGWVELRFVGFLRLETVLLLKAKVVV